MGNNFDFLRTYQDLQKGIMLDEEIDLSFASISYCAGDPSPFWNNALINAPLSREQTYQVEQVLINKQRRPAFYFENTEQLAAWKQRLESQGYSKKFEDSWLLYSKKEIEQLNFHQVKQVRDQSLLTTYLDVFNRCYQKNDPQNPYGELGDYLQKAKEAWFSNQHKLSYFIVYEEQKPVAVSALTSYNGGGYISNVGSLREVRGRGFGKLATLYAVSQSMIKKNTLHFLATEEGTYADMFYKKLGFSKQFSAVGYSK